ncbi:MAG: hypothetical protein IMZ61_08420 [Planctomycetes bacterium]|nr:hypothetical protein [Planctomycetota bacterium]
MSKAYAINYDLKVPNRDYEGLYKAIKQLGKWWHYIESTWLIMSDESSTQIWDKLRIHMDQNDFMLIIEVRNDVQGWLPKEAWDWINSYVPK